MVFRTSCLSHTTSLAVADSLKWLGCNRPDQCDLWADMTILREALPHSTREAQFHGLPSLCPTRWLSMGEFIEVIAWRYPGLHASLERDRGGGPLNALQRYNFHALAICLRAFNEFTLWSERWRPTSVARE
jgi:hypothetical protein